MWKPVAAAGRGIVKAPEQLPSWLPVPLQAAAGAEQPETQVPFAHVLPPVQSAVDKHSTHREVVPSSLQNGVAPPHAVQFAPHAVTVLHS